MSALDALVILTYALLVLALGARASRRHPSWSDLLLARRGLPVWAVLGSTVATELSAATFLGVPHAAYTGNWTYLQLAFGALVAKALLAWRVIPLYHRLGVVTVYGYLELRFGPRTRRAAAVCFVAGRTLASGARLFIAALAFATVMDLPIETAIVGCGLVAGLYTLFGGIRAVVWTDTLQAGVFLLAAFALVSALAGHAAGGASEILGWAEGEGRTRVFHFEPWLALGDAHPFWVAVCGGFFLTLATHATDHDMVQRLLTTRDGRGAARALLGSALLNFPLTALFLFIGTGLAFVYASTPPSSLPDPSRVLPTFALRELPAGLRGLLFAGLLAAAMSSLDSAICAIATTWVVDVRPAPEARRVPRLRRAAAVSAMFLMAAAIGMGAYHRALADAALQGPGHEPLSLVELALAAMTILYGGLLGVFALGLGQRGRGDDGSAVRGLLAGSVTGLGLFLHPLALGRTVIAWPWWIPIGALIAAAVAAASRSERPRGQGPLRFLGARRR
jgi:SSS family transporter